MIELVARIYKLNNKVVLHNPESGRIYAIVRHSDSIQIRLSGDEDLWLVETKNKSGAIITSMFANKIEQGGN